MSSRSLLHDDLDSMVQIARYFSELDASLRERTGDDPEALGTSRAVLADVLAALCEHVGVEGYLEGDPERCEATRAVARALLGCSNPT